MVAALAARRTLPLLGLGSSVESADDFAASAESSVVSIPGGVLEVSASSESMPFIFELTDTALTDFAVF